MIKKKLASKRGFSLSEVLVTLAIMSLVGVAIGLGISAAGEAYNNITTGSNAEMLCTTLATELADELRFAEEISTGGNRLTFTSRRFGAGVSVSSDEGRVQIGQNDILAEKAYTGLDAQATVAFEGGVFSVEIVVTRNDTQWADAHFKVSPISS